MHNLIPYSGDVFALYKEAVDRKGNGEAKERLVKAYNVIQAYYAEFDKHFSARTLRSIASGRVAAPLSGDLYDMYGFEAAIVKKVKTWLKANNPVTVYGICQFCGLKQFEIQWTIYCHISNMLSIRFMQGILYHAAQIVTGLRTNVKS